MTLDLTKPVQIRKGNSVRILTTDRKDPWDYCVVGLISHNDNDERLHCWNKEGKSEHHEKFNLVNIPVRQTGWVNVYKSGFLSDLHPSKDEANQLFTLFTRVACVKIEYTEGEGLD